MVAPSSATIISPGRSPRAIRCRTRFNGADHDRTVLGQSRRAAAQRRDRGLLRGNSDECAAHAAVPNQFAEHKACGIRGDRKADALRAQNDGSVDADDLATG